MEQNQIQVNENQVRVADAIKGFTKEEVAIVQGTVAKGTMAKELAFFLMLCQSVDLNPLKKEIWCYKDHKQNLIIMTGRDGFLSMAQRNPLFNGVRSMYVCENDEFTLDVANNKIEHNPNFKDRGEIVGAYSIVFRKDGEPTIEWADFKRYVRGNGNKFSPWTNYPEEMIKKVAESHALKKAFGLNGVQSEYDFDVKNNQAMPIQMETTKESLTPTHPGWEQARDEIQRRNLSIENVREFYNITQENFDALCG